MFEICLLIALIIIESQWMVNKKPVSIVNQPRKVMCSLPMGRMCSTNELNPPSLSIQQPVSSVSTANVWSTIDWIISGCPALTQSAAIAAEIARKLMIFPHVTSLCLNKVLPTFSITTGAASGKPSATLQNVLGCNRSSSADIRLMIVKMCLVAALGITSMGIEIFRVRSPSRRNFSLINCAVRNISCKKTLHTLSEKQ